jgi:hypothetical protein
MAGRQPKLNKILIGKICKALEKGLTRRLTCHYVAVSEVAFYKWLEEAEMVNRALEQGKELTDPMIIEIGDKTYTINNACLKIELIESVHMSEAKYLAKSLEVLDGAVKAKDVSTAKWLLERRCRKDFSSQQTVNIGNKEGETFKSEVHTKSMMEQFAEFQDQLKHLNLGNLKDQAKADEEQKDSE